MGAGIVALGLEHFIFREVTLFGFGLLASRARPRAAIVLAIAVGFSMLVVHLPVVLRSPRFESDWTKTLVITGGAILLAKNPRKPLQT